MAKSPKPKQPKVNTAPKVATSDWRNLPYDKWNVRTVHAYFADMNADMYGAASYLPMRNWSAESGMIRNALKAHGAEILRMAFDEAFRTYRPTGEYPLLTAGFAISYRINTLIPVILAEKAERERREAERESAETADYRALEGVW